MHAENVSQKRIFDEEKKTQTQSTTAWAVESGEYSNYVRIWCMGPRKISKYINSCGKIGKTEIERYISNRRVQYVMP